MKAMGIDFGLARIGVAFSDDTKVLASPHKTYHRKNLQDDIQYFCNLITEQKVDEIVCGLPMNMMGQEQEIAQKTRAFMAELTAKTAISVNFVDERLSSVMAEEFLKQTERDWKKRKEKLDSVSASIILQDYLDLRR